MDQPRVPIGRHELLCRAPLLSLAPAGELRRRADSVAEQMGLDLGGHEFDFVVYFIGHCSPPVCVWAALPVLRRASAVVPSAIAIQR